MSLITKEIKGRRYYYSFLSYRLTKGPKSFSKYVGVRKPSNHELKKIEDEFKNELIQRLSGRNYSNLLATKDEVIKSLLFSTEFNKKYNKLTKLRQLKYDIDSTVMFTLTTLVTEDVDVDLTDVKNAFNKTSGLTFREQISKNMLRAVESIRHHHRLDSNYLLDLHRTIMATFETKTPGKFRKKQVYLYQRGSSSQFEGREIAYRPPQYNKIVKLLEQFFHRYDQSTLNPVEKAAVAHCDLYRIHPFLDGNKRICRLVFNKTLLDNHFPLINISANKEAYFNVLVNSVETGNPKPFIEFTFKQYYLQVRGFLNNTAVNQ